jgi:hypothetical protein
MRDKNSFSSDRFFPASVSNLNLFFSALGEYPGCKEKALLNTSQ